ncbi:MAG: cytochrome c oxidase assembly protein [Acidimicrobiales bacterium]|jgi:putative copper resistance protein D
MFLADAISPSVSIHKLLTGWQTGYLSLIALGIELAIAGWYVWSVRRLAKRGRRWSSWRTVSFLVGTLLVVIAVQSGLAAYDDEVFKMHVIQHLILMNFAPILYALGAPMTLALQASSRHTQQNLLKVLHHPVIEFVTNPVVVVIAAYGTMLFYFLTSFYNFSLEHPLVHDFTHLHFLVSGCLFWWLVIGIDPSRWRLSHPAKLGYLAVGVPVTAILGVALTGARTSIAPHFHTVADTQGGGSILWIVGELVTLIAIAIVTYQWMRLEEREAIRADRRADAEAASAGAVAVPADGP